jgi:photosystem II stability/assembly factor-like uncharacterized protein
MTEGRVVIGGEPLGAAFLIGPERALTARHVVEAALDAEGNPRPGFEFELHLRDGPKLVAVVEAADAVLDVASVRVTSPVASWVRVGAPTRGAPWEVTTRFLPTDPVLTGTITDPARLMRNDAGNETTLVQLHVDQNVGSYEGYSGSPVCVRPAEPGVVETREAVGVLVEQGLWRAERQPGQRQVPVANVLWAAPIPAVFDALGLSREVQTYGEWRLISPEWGFFSAIQADPLEPQTVFAGLHQGQGVYRSRDGGRFWQPINAGLGNRQVRSIAVSAFDRNLYAATPQGLWKSEDRGATWAEDPDFHGKSLLCVALSPHDPDLLLVGCQRPGGGSAIQVLTAAAGPDLRTYKGTGGSGLKFSRDRGKTWTTLPTPDNINGFWVDPQDSRVFAVASAEQGVFFSRDDLEKLRRVEAFPQGQQPLCVALLPGDPDRLLVGTLRGGAHWSDDEGAHWQRADGIPDVQVSDIKLLPGMPSKVAAATPSGVFESDDRGTRWRRATKGLAYKFCTVLAPLADGSVLLGTSGGGAYRRARGQSIWNPCSKGFPPADALRLGEAGGWLLAGTSVGLYRSPDGGASWRFSGLAGKGVSALAVAREAASAGPSASATGGGLFVRRSGRGSARPVALRDDRPLEVHAGTGRRELFVSHDSGATWEPLTPPSDGFHRMIRSITLSSGPPRRIGVLVQDEGFFLSEDDGRSWSAAASAPLGRAINLVVASVHDDRKLFALTVDRGVHYSEDGGTTWTKSEGIPADEVLLAIAEPAEDAQVVFAASLLRTVYRSADGGRTFTRIGGISLPPGRERTELRWTTLVARSRRGRPTTLVLGSSLGAHLSIDEAATWTTLPAGVLRNDYHVNDLYLTDDGATLLMATREGLFARALP